MLLGHDIRKKCKRYLLVVENSHYYKSKSNCHPASLLLYGTVTSENVVLHCVQQHSVHV